MGAQVMSGAHSTREVCPSVQTQPQGGQPCMCRLRTLDKHAAS